MEKNQENTNAALQLHLSLPPDWQQALKNEFSRPYWLALEAFLQKEYQTATVYPPFPQIFYALQLTPFKKVKVVLLGQDPYHNPHQAHGLAFSVPPTVPPPPSLKNIFKELEADLGHPPPPHGCLDHWAKEGVLLLNTVLTVRANKPASHRNKGWEHFTDAVIQILAQKHTGLVFLLWGNFAKKKKKWIPTPKHAILESAHPSPLSAKNGFFGSRPFSQTNRYLEKFGKAKIHWGETPR
ncbi:MAG: uracil-DNA glycosylase [Planctomycetota bacterium]|nr:MAG: uracil-DNA glycosylase [Planctomycetota bacterium]